MMMQIQDIMTDYVQSVNDTMVAEQAYTKMKELEIHHLIVTRDDGSVGVVSERDLGGKHGASVRQGKTVGELSSWDIISVSPEDTIQDAATLLQGYTIGCLPVVEDSEVVGIVTISDLLSLIAQGVLETV